MTLPPWTPAATYWEGAHVWVPAEACADLADAFRQLECLSPVHANRLLAFVVITSVFARLALGEVDEAADVCPGSVATETVDALLMAVRCLRETREIVAADPGVEMPERAA